SIHPHPRSTHFPYTTLFRSPVRQALLTNDYQKISRIPLLIGIDGEWGLAMRLDSTVRFPRQMTLSAMNDDTLIYDMGKEITRERSEEHTSELQSLRHLVCRL